MRLSAELFLIDNFLMDYLILKLAAVLNGKRLKPLPTLAACAVGSVYAFLSLLSLPWLQHPILKLLLGLGMAIPVMRSRRGYLSAVLFLYVAAFFTGGLMFALAMTLGGSVRAGALMGTVPLRVFLIAAALSAAAPRLCRSLMTIVRARTRRTKLLMSFSDRTLELTALIDSGNLLVEPISGLPVVVVKKGLLPPGRRLVPYRTIDGEGILNAARPTTCQVYQDGWLEIDVYAAEAPNVIEGAEAIVDAALLSYGGGLKDDAQTNPGDAPKLMEKADSAPGEGDPLHPFGGDAARAVSAGGGTGVDYEACKRG